MSQNNQDGFWASVGKIALKIPVPSLLFILSYFLYNSNKNEPATAVLSAGLLLSIILVIDELYRGSIRSLKSDVSYYSKLSREASTQSFQNAAESTSMVMEMSGKYKKPEENATSTE